MDAIFYILLILLLDVDLYLFSCFVQSCEQETVWAYMEVGRICNHSSEKSMHRGDVSMDECKQFLEKQGFNVSNSHLLSFVLNCVFAASVVII